ncbi:hypothetical protein [Providencia hangzhouensis]|uniref:hypothetical protein n=1 Tax=Providencia hangzhouensis TaxID=3031799 RepID=UPI0034DCF9CB
MFTYQATVEFVEEEGAYEISFADFPDLQGVSYCREDVELEAQEILLATFAEYIEGKNEYLRQLNQLRMHSLSTYQ